MPRVWTRAWARALKSNLFQLDTTITWFLPAFRRRHEHGLAVRKVVVEHALSPEALKGPVVAASGLGPLGHVARVHDAREEAIGTLITNARRM